MPSANPAPEERPGLRRTAWILVITMSLLLALAFLGLVWGFMRQGRIMMEGRAAAGATASAPVSDTLASVKITLAPGVRIVSVQATGGRLVLQLTGPTGDEVQVLDLATGALTHQLRTAPPR
jgi:hypothetical protein